MYGLNKKIYFPADFRMNKEFYRLIWIPDNAMYFVVFTRRKYFCFVICVFSTWYPFYCRIFSLCAVTCIFDYVLWIFYDVNYSFRTGFIFSQVPFWLISNLCYNALEVFHYVQFSICSMNFLLYLYFFITSKLLYKLFLKRSDISKDLT